MLPPAIVTLLRRHPALLLTVAYLAVSLTGLVFSWAFFREFGVNYYLFADLTDFLLGAVREPASLLASAGAVIAAWLIYRYSAWEVSRLERIENRGRVLQGYISLNRRWLGSGWATVLILAVYALATISLYADWRVAALRAGQGTEVILSINGGEPVTRLLMGSSARFIFVYDAESSTTTILPDESITSLTLRD
jgi:hypothetical protein